MPRQLKVFRTSIGFHDAYVAAPSRQAALRAWGSSKDLFAAGMAEQVTDPELMKPALTSPGEVVRASRGTLEEQLSAIGPRPSEEPKGEPPAEKVRPRRKPKPSREALDAAENAIVEFEERTEEADADYRQRRAMLERAWAETSKALETERAKLEHRVNQERTKYQRRVAKWES